MDKSFQNLVEQAKSILILLPTRPYLDQVASGLSLYLSLREGKNISIYCPNKMTVEFNRLIGVNKITSDLGSKNLIIKFREYEATGIERVSYDIENQEFNLTIVPKQDINPPQKSQIDVSYSGVSADLIILIGGANPSHFPALLSKELASVKTIHIGNKQLNAGGGEVMSFAKPFSSASEVVAGLIKTMGISIDSDIASNLLMGISEATNNFASENVTADTFEMAGGLMRAGGKRKPEVKQTSPYPLRSILRAPEEKPQEAKKVSIEETDKEDKPPEDWLAPKVYRGGDS